MDPIEKTDPKPYLHLILEDSYFAERVKLSLEKKFNNDVLVAVFKNGETAIDTIKHSGDKPQVVVLDHSQNKNMTDNKSENVAAVIRKISPDLGIIILAEEKNKSEAQKALAHGANDLVIKDQFAFDHIYTAVQKCLHPVKM